MPHIILEYSSNISHQIIQLIEKNIFKEIGFIEGNFNALDCKFRSISFDHYAIADFEVLDSSFIHISFKILSTRSLEIRKKLSEKVFQIAERIIFQEGLDFKIHLSVEVIEMQKEVYKKSYLENLKFG
jgi:5-carboxymethyl-2-hydroxymuconate isomerase